MAAFGHHVCASGLVYVPRVPQFIVRYPSMPGGREGTYEISGQVEVPEDVDPADIKMILIRFARGDNDPVVIQTTTAASGNYQFVGLRTDHTYYPIALPPIYLAPAVHGPYPSE